MYFRVAEFLATGFYSGYLPKAPGTWGTVVAIPIAIGLAYLPLVWRVPAVLVITLLGTWAADVVCRVNEIKDPGYVVSDEIAGYLWGVAFFAPIGGVFSVSGWALWLTGFAVFRFFDILKPPPLKILERAPGGPGVMLDDLGAGVYTALVLLVIQLLGASWWAVQI